MTDPVQHATPEELALLRLINDQGPVSPEDSVNVLGASEGLLESLAAKDWVRRWIRKGEDTGLYQLTSAGWAEISYADNPPVSEGVAEAPAGG